MPSVSEPLQCGHAAVDCQDPGYGDYELREWNQVFEELGAHPYLLRAQHIGA